MTMRRRSLLLGAAASALSAGASQAFGIGWLGLGRMGRMSAGGSVPSIIVPVALNATLTSGDSRMSNTFDETTTRVQQNGSSWSVWAGNLNKQNNNVVRDVALSGTTADQAYTALRANLASASPRFVECLTAVNSFAAGLTDADVLGTMQNYVKYCTDRGVTPIIHADWGASNFNAQQIAYWQAYQTSLAAFMAATPAAVLVDLRSTILNDVNTPGSFKSGYSADGVHLLPPGSIAYAIARNAALAAVYPAAVDPVQPGGNLVTNSDFATGTGGSVGTGNSGTLPTGFTGSRDNANCATAFSLNTRGDGVKEIVCALTANNTTGVVGGFRLTQAIATGSFGIGDRLQIGAQIDVDAGYTNLKDARCDMTVTYADTTFFGGYNFEISGSVTTIPDATGALLLTARMPPITLAKALGSLSFRLGGRCQGVGGANIRFRKPWHIHL